MKLKKYSYRKFVSQNLRELNGRFGKELGFSVNIKDCDSIISLIRDNSIEAKGLIEKHFNDEFSLSILFLMCLSSIAASLDHKNKKKVFPNNWISNSGYPVPDLVISNMVTQIANYSLSIITLLEQGLNFPAKALIRINNDLIWQVIVLCYDKEMLKEFCSSTNPDDSTRIWYNLFGKGKLNKKICEIEETIGLDEVYISGLHDWRKNTQRFHSEIVHHSYYAINLGAMAYDFDTESIHSSLLGRACPRTKDSIGILNYQLFFFLEMFFLVMGKIHGLKLNSKNEFGYTAIIIKHICSKLIIEQEKKRT